MTGSVYYCTSRKHRLTRRLPVETEMNLPTREECERWDQVQVAFFMCQNKMRECVPTVNRLRINGPRLLNLSDSDMSKFSLIHQPQLQKIVQDIKKNDGSLLDKLKRLKSKPVPKVPARDYRGSSRDDYELSDPDYDNDMYEDPHAGHDDSYEPPPSHRVFAAASSASFPRGEYLDSCRNGPSRPPRKPLRPTSASKQLPPQPTHVESDEEDYINPDAHNDDDNYIEPEETPPATTRTRDDSRAGIHRSTLSPTERPPSPSEHDFYEVPDKEVPDKEETSLPPPHRHPATAQSSLPKPGRRSNARQFPPVRDRTAEDEYEVCDPDDGCSSDKTEGPPPLLPKPLPRESALKPPLWPRPDVKPKECESRTLPVLQSDHKPIPKAFTLDAVRPKVPLLHVTSPKPTDRGSVSSDNGSADQDKVIQDADVYKKPWYADTCDRKTADDTLFRLNKDGAFMVRKSSGQDAQQPYTLVVFYKGRVYNIPIRFVPAAKQYALGREKRGEEFFSSVSHIIENHQRNPLVLIDSQSNTKDAAKLCYPVKP